jgi:hypothetical protein
MHDVFSVNVSIRRKGSDNWEEEETITQRIECGSLENLKQVMAIRYLEGKQYDCDVEFDLVEHVQTLGSYSASNIFDVLSGLSNSGMQTILFNPSSVEGLAPSGFQRFSVTVTSATQTKELKANRLEHLFEKMKMWKNEGNVTFGPIYHDWVIEQTPITDAELESTQAMCDWRAERSRFARCETF